MDEDAPRGNRAHHSTAETLTFAPRSQDRSRRAPWLNQSVSQEYEQLGKDKVSARFSAKAMNLTPPLRELNSRRPLLRGQFCCEGISSTPGLPVEGVPKARSEQGECVTTSLISKDRIGTTLLCHPPGNQAGATAALLTWESRSQKGFESTTSSSAALPRKP